MKQAIPVFIILMLAGCGGRGQKNVARSGAPLSGEYHEMVTEYENIYTADSLLVKVVEQDYAVVGNMKSPERMRTYEYEYSKLPDGATGQRKFSINNGVRNLVAVTITSPHLMETVELQGRDTTHYELKRFDAQGQLVVEELRSKMNLPEFDMMVNNYSQTTYEYDTFGRMIKKTLRSNYGDAEVNCKFITEYRDDTDEIVSQKTFEPSSGTVSTMEYHSQHSGDTLIQNVYFDGEISHITKKTPGYSARTYYEGGLPSMQDEEINAGNVKTAISHEFGVNAGDTLRYENGLLMREARDTTDGMRTVNHYSYDSRGNPTRKRQQVWFYE